MMRTICKSRTYQLSVVTNKWNEDDEINYSHAIARRLPAEVLYDAIHRATGATSRSCRACRPGSRAAQLLDVGRDAAERVPRRCSASRPRESACECERSSGMMLGPVLKLVNGPTVADAIADPDNALDQARRQRDGRRQGGRGGLPGDPEPPADRRGTAARRRGAAGRAATERQKLAEPSWPSTRSSSPPKQAAWEATLGRRRSIWTVARRRAS